MVRSPRAILPLLILGGVFVLSATTGHGRAEAGSVTVTAIANTTCGNNIVNAGEQCDGTSLDGATCSNLGFSGGSLSCAANCSFNTSACSNPGGSGGGGNSGGGGGDVGIPPTGAVFSGLAYPKSTVTLLKDASVVASAKVGQDARFQLSLAGLSGGNYIFSLYSEDAAGNRSALSTFPVSITQGATVAVSGVFIPPTINADKAEVKKGDVITFFGQSAPASPVTISIHSEEEAIVKAVTDKDGAYSYQFDTDELGLGDHLAKSRTATSGEISAYGKAVTFKVGTKNVEAEKKSAAPAASDLNDDKRINIVDFSILAYWYKRSAPPQRFDLNHDGAVNLVDFSIMAYYWTG